MATEAEIVAINRATKALGCLVREAPSLARLNPFLILTMQQRVDFPLALWRMGPNILIDTLG